MKKNKNRGARSASLCLLATLLTTQLHAAETTAFAGGDGEDHDLTLAYRTAPLWQTQWMRRPVTLGLEYSLGLVHSSTEPYARNLFHIGATPVVRWWITPATGVELGIGANLFSGTHIAGKQISTAFQFGDTVGVVHRLQGRPWRLGLRFIHYSNADIKRPNPGQNYLQLHIGYALP